MLWAWHTITRTAKGRKSNSVDQKEASRDRMGLEASTASSHFFCPLFLNHTATLYQADLYQVSESSVLQVSDSIFTIKTLVSVTRESWLISESPCPVSPSLGGKIVPKL